MKLADVPDRCFEGVIPSIIATCDASGVPNVTYLSQVTRLDGTHVALSCQFFNKTKRNVVENPFACIEVYDPVTFDAYRLAVRYDHAEESGPLFDRMRVRIDAIASHTGMTGVFKLRSADVYEVLEAERREGFLDDSPVVPAAEAADGRPRNEVRSLHLISHRICQAKSLDELLSTVLATLDEALGFTHSMVAMLDETRQKLFVVGSHGYGETGVGAEVALGEGLIGTVARERRMLSMSGVENELRYGRAIRAGMQRTRARQSLAPEIPLAGLPDAESYLALPLIVGDRLLGVIAVESRTRMAFAEWHEAFLEIVANQVAVAIDNAVMREREREADDDEPAPRPSANDLGGEPLQFRYFRNDECVFVGDEYLIRNVPGKILWKLLREYAQSGRTTFSNRELRVDPFIGLPALRDNLESRLVLLRKRLEEKCPQIQLVSCGRGRFQLVVDRPIKLDERDGA